MIETYQCRQRDIFIYVPLLWWNAWLACWLRAFTSSGLWCLYNKYGVGKAGVICSHFMTLTRASFLHSQGAASIPFIKDIRGFNTKYSQAVCLPCQGRWHWYGQLLREKNWRCLNSHMYSPSVFIAAPDVYDEAFSRLFQIFDQLWHEKTEAFHIPFSCATSPRNRGRARVCESRACAWWQPSKKRLDQAFSQLT